MGPDRRGRCPRPRAIVPDGELLPHAGALPVCTLSRVKPPTYHGARNDENSSYIAIGRHDRVGVKLRSPGPRTLRSSSSLCIGKRKPYLETRVTRFGADLNIAAVFLHDSLHRVKAQPGAFAHPFRGEKGLKDVLSDFG